MHHITSKRCANTILSFNRISVFTFSCIYDFRYLCFYAYKEIRRRHYLTRDNCHVTIKKMIRSFHHKVLRKLFEDDDRSKLPAQDIDKITRILARLNAATLPDDMDAPGFKLHQLKGSLKGFWAVTVRANWRIIFRFKDGDALDVDLIDYH